jgi:hypothetical protein
MDCRSFVDRLWPPALHSLFKVTVNADSHFAREIGVTDPDYIQQTVQNWQSSSELRNDVRASIRIQIGVLEGSEQKCQFCRANLSGQIRRAVWAAIQTCECHPP